MTCRVIEAPRAGLTDRSRARTSREANRPSLAALQVGAATAVLVVPVAGAAEAPGGWVAAAIAALAVLCAVVLVGSRVPWGWSAALLAIVGIVLPRGQLSSIGPALFVASVICTALWLTGQGRRRGSHDSRPKAGSAERKAQELMGMYGEQHVAEVLAGELPADYVLINGLKLPRGSGDVDHVVVGPNGVFLLETKTMAGRIVCESDGTWRRTRIGRAGTPYAAYIGDPAAQVQRNIVAVRECLRSRMPRLFRGRPLWVQGMVVFAHPRTVLEAEHSRVPAVVLDRAAERICAHRSQRSLQPREVQALVDALLEEGSREQFAFARQSAQAVVEIALLLPVLLGLACGTVALSRLVQAQTAVTAVAHEAARAGALGRDPVDAVSRMRQRADLVAPGLGLNPNELILACDVTQFAQAPAHVTARVQYPVSMSDLPLVGWLPAVPVVQAAHTEWVDPFRSGIGIASGGAGT